MRRATVEHAGHRRRMIEKLKTDSLLEHELLEVLLFNALPRRNTNDLAHKLLGEFGSVKEILSAPIEQLTKVEGVGESVAAKSAASRYAAACSSSVGSRSALSQRYSLLYRPMPRAP